VRLAGIEARVYENGYFAVVEKNGGFCFWAAVV